MDIADRFSPEQVRLVAALGALLFGLILSRQSRGLRSFGYLIVLGAIGLGAHTWLAHGSALLRPSGCWVGGE